MRIVHAIPLLLFTVFCGCAKVGGSARSAPGGADLIQHTGQKIPADLQLTDELGRHRSVGMPGKPTILTLNYYECRGICGPMLTNLSRAIEKLPLEAGDYQIWTVSIDPAETPAQALRKKQSLFAGMRRPIPDSSWTFFTGDRNEIGRIADAIGYRYSRQGDGFMHPGALIILAPDGRIVRYIYGETYLRPDLEMALVEASQGRIGQTLRKALLVCFRYEPDSKSYVFAATRIGGGVLLFLIAGFAIVLRRKSRWTV